MLDYMMCLHLCIFILLSHLWPLFLPSTVCLRFFICETGLGWDFFQVGLQENSHLCLFIFYQRKLKLNCDHILFNLWPNHG
jgi:hypothetical protein